MNGLCEHEANGRSPLLYKTNVLKSECCKNACGSIVFRSNEGDYLTDSQGLERPFNDGRRSLSTLR